MIVLPTAGVTGQLHMKTEKPMTTNILVHIKNNMMKSLWKSKFADVLCEPIVYEGYKKAIGRPLDLSIIQQKLESCEYKCSDECLKNDLQEMIDSCVNYFKPTSTVHMAAKGLEVLFHFCF